ncbi:MAG: acyltransferase [Candidatus Velthaea sp.]|jgi:peptidoglycan/LPS O-acetylase OafA/YrhL
MDKAVTPQSLRPLTSLRFFAALAVFFSHTPVTWTLNAIFGIGYTGVGFFYLLSGFILTYRYYGDFAGGLSTLAAHRFYLARIARILPVYLTTMLLMLAFMAVCGGKYWSGVATQVRLAEVVAQTALVQSWIPVDAVYLGLNGQAWSVSAEMFFYALLPVVLWFATWLTRAARPPTILLAAAALWALLFGVELCHRGPASFYWFYVFPPIRLPEFTIGILLGIAFLKRPAISRAGLQPTTSELLVVGGVILATLVSPAFPASVRFSALSLPFSAALIAVFARQGGTISRLLSAPAFVRLGEISFAFYLVHLLVIDALATTPLPYLAAIPAALVISLALSSVLYHGVEEPLRRLICSTFTVRAAEPSPVR